MKTTKLTAEQAQQIEEAFENAESVAASINAGKHHVIQIDDEKCFWQREEWVRWAIDEVLPEIREALSAIRAARAQEQAEQEPVAEILVNDKDVIVLWHKTARQLGHQAKLYAAPVRTKDLTDDEIDKIATDLDEEDPDEGYWRDFARAVIAADREKNK